MEQPHASTPQPTVLAPLPESNAVALPDSFLANVRQVEFTPYDESRFGPWQREMTQDEYNRLCAKLNLPQL